MDSSKELIIVNGKDKTDSIASYCYVGNKCDVVYTNSPRTYSYNRYNVRVLNLRRLIDPNTVIFKHKGSIISNIDQIRDYGDFYRIVRSGKKELSCKYTEVQISKNCLSNEQSKELFHYFKEIAEKVSLVTDNGINILSRQYDRVTAVEDSTVLSHYLEPELPLEARRIEKPLIFPFGLNQSQKRAVENAFSSQISIIQGPPGTGKTQTILNIIANAVRNNKSVAVVSNNNSATLNVAEKMEKHGLSFLTAFLGSLYNKERFIESQTGCYPNMSTWTISQDDIAVLTQEVQQLSEELTVMLNHRNRIAQIESELLSLKPEQFYFQEYYSGKQRATIHAPRLSQLSSAKLLSLWLEYEFNSHSKPGIFKKLLLAVRYSRSALTLFKCIPSDAIPFLQSLFYTKRLKELEEEKRTIEEQLQNYHFDEKMEALSGKSMQLFKAELAQQYQWKMPRTMFEKKDFRGSSIEFNKEYPVVLSTTYSIKGTLSTDHIYDYLIVDEASQVDLVTGVLAFSCAKNIIIVGDQQQLPNVLSTEEKRASDAIWERYDFDERYRFSSHNMLSSSAEIWKYAPSVLLREHYRCHPKIANFFNQKFYNNQLIVMTEDTGEKDVLSLYRTVAGNHARGHMNQRQIDVINREVLPKLLNDGYRDIGIITPYRAQVGALHQQLETDCEIATVHKFQGREKQAIILTSVDNEIGSFVDDPNMLNVAVSRAISSLSIIVSNSAKNEKTNYGDLAKYIEYNNMEIVDSTIFSVFDLLYKGYYQQRQVYLAKHKRVSEYDSENLAYAVIEKILMQPAFSAIGCSVHVSLATLIKDESLLTESEKTYAMNPLTHVDFLLFNKMNKRPVMVIEVDGTRYHAEGTRQAERDVMKNGILKKYELPLLRIRTNESGLEEHILSILKPLI